MLEIFEVFYQATGCLRIQSQVEGVANLIPAAVLLGSQIGFISAAITG